MEILEAYDLVGTLRGRGAANLVGVDHKTGHYVAEREAAPAGSGGAGSASIELAPDCDVLGCATRGIEDLHPHDRRDPHPVGEDRGIHSVAMRHHAEVCHAA